MPTLRAETGPASLSLFRDGLAPALLTQNAAPDHRPFIHPLLAPDGAGELTENEPGHHLWQHGLYTGLNDVNGVGFWTEGLNNSRATDGTFHPQPLASPALDGNTARWSVVTEWHSPHGEPMLTETQTWHLTDRGDTLTLDLDWHLQALTDLRFGKYAYGGLFLRMPWRKETGATLLTSDGAITPADAEGKTARWVALCLPLPGRTAGPAGIALLDHPANFRHPVPWRVDDSYGVGPSPCIAGEWFLAQGEATVSRCRVFAFTGAIAPATIEAQWRDFARL